MKSKSNYSGFKGTLKLISTIISWTILVILILIALFLAYFTIGNKLAEKKGEKFDPIVSLFTIISPSMTPNINTMDVVMTRRINGPDDIKIGDVITFVSTSSISRGKTITHRVIDIGSDEDGITYTTKGDNNLSPDGAPAKYSNVIGKVILRIPQLGRLQTFLASQGGWFIAIVIPALLIIINDILKVFKLAGVKNKIEKIEKTETASKIEQEKREEIRKDALKKRLKTGRSEFEPDPIPVKKSVRIVVAVPKNKQKRSKNNT